ncbi:hypothetical protein GUITHDRAFT_152447 [Guillardia theta CCMP2712]|uniref:PDZ domain-containing protein n=3 Tax=Guillardia theta TaxID=55529 RepID=L1JDU5_GUITC|nr:hypothetical protein GUITHDRAFT_152447 [Guillardia theta CCMP2712]EKX46274.1 hypothetical protein GUITHDRAFT_152447 [Guillardia theta CCMP2712]|mmetsp:Transcript_8928/g.29836  ORF Transcript_8928/g.29836 Transcript_8928/m.29836 type:complete len:106 (+) Transcript_8928:465-782(+)|eukprot:XP_005833254.1 hypothetical protein GUITHDRAFT_152447 [Guillardia theta CCMP2712]
MNASLASTKQPAGQGKRGGVGIVCCHEDLSGALRVIACVKGSPAERSKKIFPGMALVKIDEEPVEGKSMERIGILMGGTIGSSVRLTLLQPDKHPVSVTLQRAPC